MREIKAEIITKRVADLIKNVNVHIDQTMIEKIREARAAEESSIGKEILLELLENAKLAAREGIPLCQDTGLAVFFVEIGEGVVITGGNLYKAIKKGTHQGYTEGRLRSSMVSDPLFDRKNTGDNTPPVVHLEQVPGTRLRIRFTAKGAGSENMSRLKMLTPGEGVEGVKQFVIKTVKEAGPNPCPPLVVGVGIGGNMEVAPLLAKKALLETFTHANPDPRYAQMEAELLKEINSLGIGPMGLGGRTTALKVHIKEYPCHIASLPVAVNLNCHAVRHGEIIL